MKIGIIGSRRRNTEEDRSKLYLYLSRIGEITKIVTGDCDKSGDKFARDFANDRGIELDVKRIKDPQTGEEMDFKNHKWFDWFTMCTIFYDRNEEIAKEPLDYLIALVAPDRKGGTENTIRHFRRLHKDWMIKLIIL